MGCGLPFSLDLVGIRLCNVRRVNRERKGYKVNLSLSGFSQILHHHLSAVETVS